VAGQFQGELIQTMIQNDPEIMDFLNKLYEENINPAMVNFFNEGIQQGYITPKISTEAILLYLDIIRHGFYGTPDIPEQVSKKPELLKELIQIITYGLNG
jgi:hypothetical protein